MRIYEEILIKFRYSPQLHWVFITKCIRENCDQLCTHSPLQQSEQKSKESVILVIPRTVDCFSDDKIYLSIIIVLNNKAYKTVSNLQESTFLHIFALFHYLCLLNSLFFIFRLLHLGVENTWAPILQFNELNIVPP